MVSPAGEPPTPDEVQLASNSASFALATSETTVSQFPFSSTRSDAKASTLYPNNPTEMSRVMRASVPTIRARRRRDVTKRRSTARLEP